MITINNDKNFKEKKPQFVKVDNKKMFVTGFFIGESKKYNYILVNRSEYIKVPKKYGYEKANYLYLFDNKLEAVAINKYSYSIYSLSDRNDINGKLYAKEIIDLESAKSILLKLLKSYRNTEEKERIKEEILENGDILSYNYTKFSIKYCAYKYADTENKVFVDKFFNKEIEEYKEYNFYLLKKEYIRKKSYKLFFKKEANTFNILSTDNIDYDEFLNNDILDLSNDDRFIPVIPKKEKNKRRKVKK